MFCGNSIILINGQCPSDDNQFVNDFIKEQVVIGKRGIGYTTSATAPDSLKAQKFKAFLSCQITRLGFTFYDGANGDKLLLGIYNDNGSGYPGDLLGVTEEFTISNDIAIDKGLDVILNLNSPVNITKDIIYWLVYISESNSEALYGTNTIASVAHCISKGYTYDGSLPDPFPSGGGGWYPKNLFGLI
jgi:hypothetical protein